MKIVNISLDKSILDKDSRSAKRIIEYGKLVNEYIVIVSNKIELKIVLSENIGVFAVGGNNKFYSFWKMYRQVNNLLKHENFSLITVQDQYYLGFLGWLLAKKYKIGLELQVHGWEKEAGLRRVIAAFVLPKADAVRTVSQRLQGKLIKEYKVNQEKITVVSIYVDVFNQKTMPKVEKDKFIFLTVTRLVPIKNIGLQIEAIAQLINDRKNIELWIVGEGPEKEKLQKMANDRQIENYIKFWGWQPDVDRFYNQADVFLLTSYAEGWPLVIVEAARYGLPIIMTDVGSAGELIINNESGLVIPVNDSDALVKAMSTLITNRNLRERLGNIAQQKLKQQQLSWEDTLKLYSTSWDKAMTNARIKYK